MSSIPSSASSAPYGSWNSPLSALKLAGGSDRLSGLACTEDGRIWWSESRPEEKGRVVLVARSAQGTRDVFGDGWSARSSVHEYGGGAWWLGLRDGYFVNKSDQRIYSVPNAVVEASGQAEPRPITPESDHDSPGAVRYADGDEHPHGSVLAVVQERHSDEVGEARNAVVFVQVGGDIAAPKAVAEPVVAAGGADFYAAPRFSPDGRFMSWVQWNHPQMPWTGAELWMAAIEIDKSGVRVVDQRLVAGSSQVSVVGPGWTSGNRLVFSTDDSGFWNLDSYDPDTQKVASVSGYTDAEVGSPPWVFGTQQWVELADGRLAFVVTRKANDSLVVAQPDGTGAVPIVCPYTHIAAVAAGNDGDVVVAGSSPSSMVEISTVNVDRSEPQGRNTVHRGPSDRHGLDVDMVSQPQAVLFATGDRTDENCLAHAFFYPPCGRTPDGDVRRGEGSELPPLLVMGHGGPTAHSVAALNLKVQYWTTRGFAVLDVNYRGSTGFGREYRRLLDEQWGVADVQDCVNAAAYVAERGLVDPDRMAIRGSSAGGLTVLRSLQEYDVFAAGTSLYGVADLEGLVADTHKFESRYFDGLVGPYPDQKARYQNRSPVNHTDKLRRPMLIMQGLLDKVVPPSQSEAIVAALERNGVPHIYVTFPEESHGFRLAESMVRSFEVELWFYGQIFGFEVSPTIQPPVMSVGFGDD